MGWAVRLHGIGIIIPLPLGLFPVFSCLSVSMCNWSIKVPFCHLGWAAFCDHLSMEHKAEEPLHCSLMCEPYRLSFIIFLLPHCTCCCCCCCRFYGVKTPIFIATIVSLNMQSSSLIANHCSVILDLISRNLQSSDHVIAVFCVNNCIPMFFGY